MRIRQSIIVCVAVIALGVGGLSGCATNGRSGAGSTSDDGWLSDDVLLIGAAVLITLAAGFAAANQTED